MLRLGMVCLALAVSASPLAARHETAGCGTSDTTPAEVLFLHRQAQRARAARMRPLAAAPVASTNRDIGNVAIIEDSDGVVEKLNQFDLDGATLTFTPVAGGAPRYRYAYSGLGYDGSAAAQGSPVIALGDDDARQFALPFAFSFYGTTYRQVFLNSDGNLTFTAAEFASSSRSVGRMTGGPPRISPLFDDLDPSQPGGGVRFFADASHVVFSWVNVPEYGPGAPQTFQVRLYVDGSIQFSYSAVNPTSAVVGIAPGFAQPGTSVVSFLNDVSAEYSAAVVERFGNTLDIDIVSVAQKFYQTHEDAYDYLVVYNNMQHRRDARRAGLRGHGAIERHRLQRGAAGLWPAVRVGGAAAERDEHGAAGLLSGGCQRDGAGAGGGPGYSDDGTGARVGPPVSGLRQHSRSRRILRPSR